MGFDERRGKLLVISMLIILIIIAFSSYYYEAEDEDPKQDNNFQSPKNTFITWVEAIESFNENLWFYSYTENTRKMMINSGGFEEFQKMISSFENGMDGIKINYSDIEENIKNSTATIRTKIEYNFENTDMENENSRIVKSKIEFEKTNGEWKMVNDPLLMMNPVDSG